MKGQQIISGKEIKEHFNLTSVLHKKVIAENGEILGKVKDVAFDMNKVIGIYTTKGYLIEKTYIKQLLNDSIILKINPVISLVGKIVFDKDGKKIGKVKKVVRKDNSNDFTELIVKGSIFRKSLHIPKKKIETMDKNIILKKIL